jgi:hypothetical protein
VEIWKPVVGYEELYEVSNQGNVRSLDRTIKTKNNVTKILKGKTLKKVTGSHGRVQIMLWKDNKQKCKYVSHLVAEAFIGPRPKNLDVLHGEKGVSVNTPENLSYGTKSKNMGKDRLRDGTDNRGEKCGIAKLTEKQVIRYKTNKEKWTTYRWAKEFNVAYSTLHSIKTEKSWVWLKP